MAVPVDSTGTTGFQTCSVRSQFRSLSHRLGGELGDRLRKQQLKGLILAQNERWRRGLGMQVERFM